MTEALERSVSTPEGDRVLGVGVVGCGLIGRRRAHVAHNSRGEVLVAVADIDQDVVQQIAGETGARGTNRWQEIVADPAIDVVVVATPNILLMPVAVAAMDAGKHVLIEKPPGRNAWETEQMVEAARRNERILKVGFNHRYHPAIWKAHDLVADGAIGEIMYGRAVYGHGARPGYEKEWRTNAEQAGGGELLDQGVHLVDLFRWFIGEVASTMATTGSYFWDLGCYEDGRPVEDNGFALLRFVDGQTAQMQVSWTQWKNRFTFEVYGKDGFVQVEGLGRSYGTEKLTLAKRRPESGPPDLEAFTFDRPDASWQREWEDFIGAIRAGRQPLSHGEDALRTMKVIAASYRSAYSDCREPV